MSRLPPALGIAPMAGRQQAVSKQQQAFEQDNGRIIESVYLSSRESIDASLQVSTALNFEARLIIDLLTFH